MSRYRPILRQYKEILKQPVSLTKKAVYDFKGIKSLLVGMSGGKTLTIYFVASPAAKNFVSCVMSFWNNDSIGTSGLPALLEEVMQLKK